MDGSDTTHPENLLIELVRPAHRSIQLPILVVSQLYYYTVYIKSARKIDSSAARCYHSTV